MNLLMENKGECRNFKKIMNLTLGGPYYSAQVNTVERVTVDNSHYQPS